MTMTTLVIETNGIRYIPIAAVEAAHKAGTVDQLLAVANSNPLIVEPSPVPKPERPFSLYNFPRTFREGATVFLKTSGKTHKGTVAVVGDVQVINWGSREHTATRDFLANMEELNAVYDGISTFTVY